MKKFIAFLFLSLFVSQINAAMMPVELKTVDDTVATSSHDHCQELVQASHPEDAKSSGNASLTHYCCAALAILIAPPQIFASKQLGVYSSGNPELLISKIAESIYKPPRNYL